MNDSDPVMRDERTVAVADTSYRWGYMFLAFAVLIDMVCRIVLRREAAWDLMALVIVSSAFCSAYQIRHRILPRSWIITSLLIACMAAALAAAIAAILAMTHAL